MKPSERVRKRVEAIADKHAEDYDNHGIQAKKTRFKKGRVTVAVDLEKKDKRKLNIIAVMQAKKIRDITEQALREFLEQYDEHGKFIDPNKKPA